MITTDKLSFEKNNRTLELAISKTGVGSLDVNVTAAGKTYSNIVSIDEANITLQNIMSDRTYHILTVDTGGISFLSETNKSNANTCSSAIEIIPERTTIFVNSSSTGGSCLSVTQSEIRLSNKGSRIELSQNKVTILGVEFTPAMMQKLATLAK